MWLNIEIFGFRALWSPYFIIFLLFLAFLYYLITGPLRHNFGNYEQPSVGQQITFYSGLVVLYIVKGSPVDLLSHIMLSAHMVQMAVLFFIFPIFMLKGIPVWIWEKVVNAPIFKNIFKFLTIPLIAVLLFSTILASLHAPGIFDFTKSSKIIHMLTTLVILFFSFIMYWPVMPPIKEHDRMQPLVKMAYLIFSSIIITIACALIIFSENIIFDAYTSDGSWMQALSLCVPSDVLSGLASTISGPEMFSPLSAKNDQQLGGIIMKMMQEIVYAFIIGRIFFKWFSKDSLKVDPLPDKSYTQNI